MVIQPDDVIARVDALPAFPTVVTRILATLDDERAAVGVLEQHLQSDPVISARVLAEANRLVRHSGRDPVGELHTAVSYLGLRRVHDVVVATSLLDFARNSHCSTAYWERSLAVGLCAQELAALADAHPDHALVAGLLHEVGTLWMQVCHADEYQQALIEQQVQSRDLPEAEHALLGLDHLQVGRLLATHWGLPHDIVEAMAWHRTPPAQPTPLVAVVHLARVICCGLDLPFDAACSVRTVSAAALHQLVDDWPDRLPELLGRLQVRHAQALTLLR